MAANNRIGLVVGASRGLGLGLAAQLKSRGWDVVATVRDRAGAQDGDRRAHLAGQQSADAGQARIGRRASRGSR